MMLSTRTSLRNIRPRKDCSVEATEREEEEAMSSRKQLSRSLEPKLFGLKSRSIPFVPNIKNQNLMTEVQFGSKQIRTPDYRSRKQSVQSIRTSEYYFIVDNKMQVAHTLREGHRDVSGVTPANNKTFGCGFNRGQSSKKAEGTDLMGGHTSRPTKGEPTDVLITDLFRFDRNYLATRGFETTQLLGSSNNMETSKGEAITSLHKVALKSKEQLPKGNDKGDLQIMLQELEDVSGTSPKMGAKAILQKRKQNSFCIEPAAQVLKKVNRKKNNIRTMRLTPHEMDIVQGHMPPNHAVRSFALSPGDGSGRSFRNSEKCFSNMVFKYKDQGRTPSLASCGFTPRKLGIMVQSPIRSKLA